MFSMINAFFETSDVYNTCEPVESTARPRRFGSLREGTIYTLASSKGTFTV